MSLTRRLFLRNTAVASAVGVTVTTAPAARAEPQLTPRERLDAAIAELQAATMALWPDVDHRSVHEASAHNQRSGEHQDVAQNAT